MKQIGMLCGMLIIAVNVYAAGAPVRIDEGDTVTARTDVLVTTAATLVASSNSNRAALNCTTDADVRWGGPTVTATNGQNIPANGSVAIKNTAGIYMITSVDTANVSCTEESWQSVSSGSGVFSP